MCQICEKIINEVWQKISVGQRFKTPDLYKGADFTIQTKNKSSISIVPQKISISRAAFLNTIHYLRTENHDINSPCEIRSSNDRKNAGPLCVTARDENNNVRCINYILPILQKNIIVGINPVRPNKTWLLKWK
jgi:hypothetical protein